jgi:hypothetical protein
MRDICLPCHVEYRVALVGVTVLEVVDGAVYAIYAADVLSCPRCGHSIVCARTLSTPLEHWHSSFADALSGALALEARDPNRIVRVYGRVRDALAAEKGDQSS